MRCSRPVETTWMGSFALARTSGSSPKASATGVRSRRTAPNDGAPWVMTTRPGLPSATSMSSGNVPIPTCWKMRVTGSCRGNRPAQAMTYAVPTLG